MAFAKSQSRSTILRQSQDVRAYADLSRSGIAKGDYHLVEAMLKSNTNRAALM